MARGPMPIVDYQDLYKESGELLRHYLSWREKLLAGYFAVMAGLAIAVGAMQDQFKPIAASSFHCSRPSSASYSCCWTYETKNCSTDVLTLEQHWNACTSARTSS